MDKMYSFNEISLIPAVKSQIKSRKDVSPFVKIIHGVHNEEVEKLPIFIAPMTCLVDKNNYDKINKETPFIPILPVRPDMRSYTQDVSSGWRACTIAEFREMVEWDEKSREKVAMLHYQICIDCANGHMEELFDLVSRFKKYNSEAEIMIGNVANPETYLECCKAGIDYVRVGIGGGSGCTTSVQTGFHASLPWLLEEIQKIKVYTKRNMNGTYTYYGPFVRRESFRTLTKVVADGGINDFHKIVKALALGADYVMIGKMFATTDLACGETKEMYCRTKYVIPPIVPGCYDNVSEGHLEDIPGTGKLHRHYYGQSSELGQKDRFGHVKSNPEGIDIWVPIEYTIERFSKKVEDVLSSAMSYASAKTLDKFIGRVKYEIQSAEEFNSYNK